MITSWKALIANSSYRTVLQTAVVITVADRHLPACSTASHDTCLFDSNRELKIQCCPNMTAVRCTQIHSTTSEEHKNVLCTKVSLHGYNSFGNISEGNVDIVEVTLLAR